MSKIKVVRVRVMVSIASRAIRRCVRWDKKRRSEIIRVSGRMEERGKAMAGGVLILSLIYKTNAYKSFSSTQGPACRLLTPKVGIFF